MRIWLFHGSQILPCYPVKYHKNMHEPEWHFAGPHQPQISLKCSQMTAYVFDGNLPKSLYEIQNFNNLIIHNVCSISRIHQVFPPSVLDLHEEKIRIQSLPAIMYFWLSHWPPVSKQNDLDAASSEISHNPPYQCHTPRDLYIMNCPSGNTCSVSLSNPADVPVPFCTPPGYLLTIPCNR